MKIAFALFSFLVAAASTSAASGSAPLAQRDASRAPISEGAGAWEPMGGGMDGSVNSLAVYRGELIAAGGFTMASGHAADRIARWTGSEWAAMPGGGADGGIQSIIAYRDWLIATGSFETIGGVEADGLARWDGSQWSSIPGNLFLSIDGMAVYGDTLVVIGVSLASGAMEHIAAWNGSAWSALGEGLEDSPDAIGVHAGILYTSANLPFPATGDAIWSWNGAAWSVFEDQLDERVYAYGSDHGRLVAAGRFRSIGGTTANRIAAWDGAAWVPLGAGIGNGFENQRVEVLANYGGDLWAGGFFELAGGATASHIARWDGSGWPSPGSGADGTVSSFVTYNGALVAAGSFAVMDGQDVNFVASWTSDPVFGNGFE